METSIEQIQCPIVGSNDAPKNIFKGYIQGIEALVI